MRAILLLVVSFFLLGPPLVLAQTDDVKAPIISSVKIGTTTKDTVTLTWETNEKADSSVNYGLQPDYGMVRVPVSINQNLAFQYDRKPGVRLIYQSIQMNKKVNLRICLRLIVVISSLLFCCFKEDKTGIHNFHNCTRVCLIRHFKVKKAYGS